MVIHFCEDHNGRKQEVLFRVITSHLTALDRQTSESVNIISSGKNPGENLNNKSEWGGAKIPGLLVSTPKGIASDQEVKEDKGPEVSWVLTSKGRGQKRFKYWGDDTGKELEEQTDVAESQGDEVLLDPRPSKSRRTLETPAREVVRDMQETFLQVFRKLMRTKAAKLKNLHL